MEDKQAAIRRVKDEALDRYGFYAPARLLIEASWCAESLAHDHTLTGDRRTAVTERMECCAEAAVDVARHWPPKRLE